MNLRVHDRFGPYELLAALGERGLGEVWKGRDSTNGRLVALRILPSPPPTDPFRFARFEHDVRKLEAWTHPNIATVYGLLDVDRVRALAFEWVEGPSLAERLSHGALPVDEAVSCAAQIASALGAAHARDLVHGDLKPSNITLRADGTVKIVDFGLGEVFASDEEPPPTDALPAGSARLMAVITGTSAYMSPEQLRGAHADSRADVWAFGCVLYEMLTGREAFAADDVAETLRLVVDSGPEWTFLPATTPASITRTLRRCLDKDLASRFQRGTEVLASMREAVGDGDSIGTIIPPDSDSDILALVEKEISRLRRWARTRLPPGTDIDVDDLVQDTVLSAASRLEGFPPLHPKAMRAYLKQAVLNRIRDVVRARSGRRHGPAFDAHVGSELFEGYGEALASLNPRDRELIRSRLEKEADYDEIAHRLSLPSGDSARMAVSRALRRLLDFFTRKKRD